MNLVKRILPIFLIVTLFLCSGTAAFACTGVYIGSSVSANGSIYMGRSEDSAPTKIFGVAEAKDYPDDYVYEDTYGFSMPYGGHTYKYTYLKDTPEDGGTMTDADGNYIFEPFAEAGINEKGVSLTATVSTNYYASYSYYYGEEYTSEGLKADPLVEKGICEISLGTVLLGKSSTAREAVELLAGIIDKYGAGECNSVMISDPDETWYFEILSGHQYAAIKMPADKVSVQPNLVLLGVIDVNDTDNVVTSKDLITLAEENGFLVTDASGRINVAKTYSENNSGKGQYDRYYQGLFFVNQAAALALGWNKDTDFSVGAFSNNDPDNGIELLLDASSKLSTLDIFHLLATRGEGTTDFNANTDDNVYAIGNEKQTECHIFETRSNLPAELSTIQWQAMAPSEYTVFLPYYSALITDVYDKYNEASMTYTDNTMFWTFTKLYQLCSADRENMVNVKAYFEKYQKSLIEQQKAVDKEMETLYKEDPEKAAETATVLGKSLASQTLKVARTILQELEVYNAGSKEQAFMPTAAEENLMPVYSIDGIENGNPEIDKLAIKTGVETTTIKAKTTATKGSITVNWTKSKGFKVDYFEIFRSTKKNSGYGTEAFYTTKTGSASKYTNTKQLKKGIRYYYKVRGVRVIEGEKVYTQSTKAWRIAK